MRRVWLFSMSLTKYAAGVVVTMDVPPYAVVGGTPSRILRMRDGTDCGKADI